jgi:hypothetical protein
VVDNQAKACSWPTSCATIRTTTGAAMSDRKSRSLNMIKLIGSDSINVNSSCSKLHCCIFVILLAE